MRIGAGGERLTPVGRISTRAGAFSFLLGQSGTFEGLFLARAPDALLPDKQFPSSVFLLFGLKLFSVEFKVIVYI